MANLPSNLKKVIDFVRNSGNAVEFGGTYNQAVDVVLQWASRGDDTSVGQAVEASRVLRDLVYNLWACGQRPWSPSIPGQVRSVNNEFLDQEDPRLHNYLPATAEQIWRALHIIGDLFFNLPAAMITTDCGMEQARSAVTQQYRSGRFHDDGEMASAEWHVDGVGTADAVLHVRTQPE